MSSLVSGLYSIARAAAWTRALVKLAQGNPKPLARRIINKETIYKPISKLARKL